MSPDIIKRFWEKVEKRGSDECWNWKAAKQGGKRGYGVFGIKYKLVLAHRFAYFLSIGKNPIKGICVCHKCDNRLCCNPSHLFPGSHLDNIADMVKKGRNPKGTMTHASHLTDGDILEIRSGYKSGLSMTALSGMHSIGIATIHNIVSGKTWKHIGGYVGGRKNRNMSRSSKGSSYEREIAKQLSVWWSTGLGLKERTDIFWRSSQSGGRATQRAKSGLTTHGSYGDLTALDPIGAPFIQFFCVELKRGYSDCSAGALLDSPPKKHKVTLKVKQREFDKLLLQAVEAHKAAKSKTWLLIHRRDYKIPIAYLEWDIYRALRRAGMVLPSSWARFTLRIIQPDGLTQPMSFVGIPLHIFLKRLTPPIMEGCLNE